MLTTVVVGLRSTVSLAGALSQARALATELPDRQNTSRTEGEAESHEWWVEHAELLEAARVEYGPKHTSLYDFAANVESFIQPELLAAIRGCERAASEGELVDESAVLKLLSPAGPQNVWRMPLFTEHFCKLLLAWGTMRLPASPCGGQTG